MSVTANQRGRIAAVFDIDGTLIPAPSLEMRLLADLALARKLRARAILAWLRSLLSQVLGISRPGAEVSGSTITLHQNKIYLHGVRIEIVEEWIALEFQKLEFFSEAMAMINWHRRRGHAIVLLSGTLAPLARAVGNLLAGDAEIFVKATELERVDDGFTGRAVGEAICGPAKERALMRLAAENNFDLSRSYAYADSWKDRWLLGAVGHPIAVNAGARLAQLARKSGWHLANWNGRTLVPTIYKCLQHSDTDNSMQTFAEKPSWK